MLVTSNWRLRLNVRQVLGKLPWSARVVAVVAVGAWLWRADGVPPEVVEEADPSAAISRLLAQRGLQTDPAEVHFVDPPSGYLPSRFKKQRVIARSRLPGQPSDIYLLDVRVSPEGRLLELLGIYNITDTSAVDERQLTAAAARVAWTIGAGAKIYSIHYADLRGEGKLPKWSRLAIWQRRLTNLQETGQEWGILRRSFKLKKPASKLAVGFSEDALSIEADGQKVRVPTERSVTIDGAAIVQENSHPPARPGNLITWAVDRVRAMSWFGAERMQLVKAIAFYGLDHIEQMVGSVTSDDGSEEVISELGELFARPTAEYTDPETGWPPAPMEPLMSQPLRGEGKWVSLEGDPFIKTNSKAPNPFVFSFIRTDMERAYSQVYVLLWDPRQLELHAVSGTVEPKSATGETGSGIVPRDPKIISRLVAGFNGGFQARHGDFGMMADREVYLPPKPYAATVAEMKDGSTGFGTWPPSPEIPPELRSFRQNLTPLVVDDAVNPYRRYWWGGTPHGWDDDSRTVRSGLCMTKEGFAGYFYGNSLDPNHLVLAMQRARCTYGMHLDMNAGHVGLEFFHVARAGQLPEVGRPLNDVWEARASVPNMTGWAFLSRRMLKYMALMNFPRYIERQSRDFFYLTLRHLLPGENLEPRVEPAEPDEGVWSTTELPQHGWPYAAVSTEIRPDRARPETRLSVIKIDPKAVIAMPASDKHERTIVHFATPTEASAGTMTLWLADNRFSLSQEPPAERAVAISAGYTPTDPRAVNAVAAIGAAAGSILYYAVITADRRRGADAGLLTQFLKEAGCDNILLLSQTLGVAPDGRDEPQRGSKRGIRLVRGEVPGARRIFSETRIVSPQVWAPLQAKPVAYVVPPTPPAER